MSLAEKSRLCSGRVFTATYGFCVCLQARNHDFGRRGAISFDPREALSLKFAQNGGFPLKIPWKLHDFEEILGARGAQAPWIRCCRPHTVDQNPGPELVLDVYKCLHKQTWRFHVWKTSVTNAIATLKGSLKSLEIAYKLGKLEVTLKSTWHTFALIRQLGAKAKKNVR